MRFDFEEVIVLIEKDMGQEAQYKPCFLLR